MTADEQRRQVAAAVGAIRERSGLRPVVGLVPGTGQEGLAAQVQVEVSIPWGGIPGFPSWGHRRGELHLGTMAGSPVALLAGRVHRYEGGNLKEITFPVRVLRALGVHTLLLSGACGGMNPLWRPGELVLLDDIINFMGDNPLIGENVDEWGPRFPDMSIPFDHGLQEVAREAALRRGIRLNRGVYVAVTGPGLETRAEYRMLRALGGDVVGMSTVPEVIVARHMGMRVLGITIITDQCLPDALGETDMADIIRIARDAEPHLSTLFRDVVASLGEAA